MKLSDYRLFCLDLDDTLYLERDYVLSGLSAVAQALAQEGASAAELEAWLHRRFLEAGRAHIFDHCLAAFGLPGTPDRIEALVAIYRNHDPKLQFLPGAQALLDRLSQIGRVVLVTDGLPSVQAKKCRALGMCRWAQSIVYCWEHQAPKPSPAALASLLTQYPGPALMIGDNPGHDLCLAEQLYIDAVRVRQGRFAQAPSEPWAKRLEVNSIAELLDHLMA